MSSSVEITRYTYGLVEGTGWDIHAGVDLSYFLNKHVGLGGLLRITSGDVTMDDTTGESWNAGGVQYGVGLRLRF